MRRLLFLVGLLLSSAASAQMPWQSGVGTPAAATSSYVGPGDQATFTAFYSFQALDNATAAAATRNLYHVIRASDSHECDVKVANTGLPGNTSACGTGGDNGQSGSAFCNATTCTGWWYDQVGSKDLSVAIDHFPNLIFNCVNTSLPCFQGNNSNIFLATASFTPGAAGVALYAIANRTVGTAAMPLIIHNGGGGDVLRATGAPNLWVLQGETTGNCVNTTASDTAWHLGIGIVAVGGGSLTVDGGTPATGTCVGSISAGRIESFAATTDVSDQLEVAEMGLYENAAPWTGSEPANLHTNAVTRWGTP